MENYTTRLSTFLFRREWADVFLAMTDEQAGQLIKYIYLYIKGEAEELPEDPQAKTAYIIITQALNFSARKHLNAIGALIVDE